MANNSTSKQFKSETDQSIARGTAMPATRVSVHSSKATDAKVVERYASLTVTTSGSNSLRFNYPVKEMGRRQQVMRVNRKAPSDSTS